MKPLTPIKTAALVALALGPALPAAHAQPAAPVKPVPLPAVALPHMRLQAAPPPEPSKALITIATMGDVTNALGMLFQGSHKSYVIEPGVSGTVDVNLNGVPFDAALTTLLEASSQPLEWSVERGVYHIRPRTIRTTRYPVVDGATGTAPAAPRQVQLKFEWVSAASAPNAAPDKSVDALTIVAEEGRKAQVSSQHLQNGAGGQETISVLAHLEPGGVVALDITERSDSTAHAGDTKSNSAETTVRVKDGETGAVRGQISKQSGQSAERMLFVTPTIVRSADGSSSGTRFAPIQTGDGVQKVIAALRVRRDAELSGVLGPLKTPQHPDIIALDALISRLQQRQKAGARAGNSSIKPVPDKTP